MSCVVQNTKDDQFSFIQPTKNRTESFQLHIFLLLKSTIIIHTSLLRKKKKKKKREKNTNVHTNAHTIISLMSDLTIQLAGKLKDLSEHSLCVADRPAKR